MNLKEFLKKTFGKDLFSHLKSNEILEERIRAEKRIEKISDDMKGIQEKIQNLMLESKGQPAPMKMLNIQKIKTLRLESATKQQEANAILKELQLLLLVEAMKEHHKNKENSELVDRIMNADIDHLNETLFTEDVKRAVREGRIDDVKDRLRSTFAKADTAMDEETRDLMGAIEDLEQADEESALKMAKEKAKNVTEAPLKKKLLALEE
ncbi:MAG: hypothetical protein DRH37_09715 [Deltaproteobacteria bacterium]|nr:MAG: hypothetical protein DRH37_09715 [Deltaproteobacteria bacterium]